MNTLIDAKYGDTRIYAPYADMVGKMILSPTLGQEFIAMFMDILLQKGMENVEAIIFSTPKENHEKAEKDLYDTIFEQYEEWDVESAYMYHAYFIDDNTDNLYYISILMAQVHSTEETVNAVTDIHVFDPDDEEYSQGIYDMLKKGTGINYAMGLN